MTKIKRKTQGIGFYGDRNNSLETTMVDTLSPDTLLNQLQWRYAVKKFDPTGTIPDAVWHALEQSLVLTPSSFGLQPWKFFVITDKALRQELLPHSWGQTQVVDASHLVVLAIKQDFSLPEVDRFIQRTAEVRGTTLESLEGFAKVIKGFIGRSPDQFDVNAWSTNQVYIALGQLMTAAAVLGIDTCPMEGFIPDQYDKILKLSDQGYHAVVLCPCGYRADDDKYSSLPKVRYPTSEVVQYI